MDYRKSHINVGKGEEYDKSFLSSDYRLFILNWEKEILSKVISELIYNKSNYLDFACGTGRITHHVEKHFNRSFGIDISESMTKEAEKKLISTKIILKDITKENPFTENQMDLISSFRFFLNAEEKLRSEVLIQLHKILKDDGLFIFNIHNNKTIISRTIDMLAIAKKGLSGKTFTPQNSLSIKSTRLMLEKHNFKIVKMYHKAIIPIKSEKTKLKFSRFSGLEDFFSKQDIAKYFSRNIIYVCRKV